MVKAVWANRSIVAKALFLASLIAVLSTPGLQAQGGPCGPLEALECGLATGPLMCAQVCGGGECCIHYGPIEGSGNCLCTVVCNCSMNQ